MSKIINKKTLCITTLSILTVLVSFDIYYKYTNRIPFFNEDQTVCYSIGFDGWKRVTKKDRIAIAELVAVNKARIIEAQTLTCYDYAKTPLQEIILREQWWKRGK